MNSNLDLSGGIMKDRSCTDVLMLILFVVYMGAMGYATSYAFKNGDI